MDHFSDVTGTHDGASCQDTRPPVTLFNIQQVSGQTRRPGYHWSGPRDQWLSGNQPDKCGDQSSNHSKQCHCHKPHDCHQILQSRVNRLISRICLAFPIISTYTAHNNDFLKYMWKWKIMWPSVMLLHSPEAFTTQSCRYDHVMIELVRCVIIEGVNSQNRHGCACFTAYNFW